MKNQKTILWLIVAILFLLGAILYPSMPEQMASHWNIDGEVDGYMSKLWGVFLTPFASLGLVIIFLLIPKIDPLKANIEKFRKYYDEFVLLILLFLSYVYLLTIFWNLGYRFNMTTMIFLMIAPLFYYSGILIENAKRNWFIGIRTPWTLSSEKVWNKTHQIGGKLFKLSGALVLLGILFERYALFFVIVPILLSSVYLFVYSYYEYQKENKDDNRNLQ
ncbi:SdpI family protein [Candidatus Parcubacteria bacterium]|nr:SdpI family protein [Candidatus Parcubacteria bacterium]